MPEPVRGQQQRKNGSELSFDKVWQALHNEKTITVSKSSDGRILVTMRAQENKVSMLFDRDEVAGLVFALARELMK